VASHLPRKIQDQIDKAELPIAGAYPFQPLLTRNRNGDVVITKRAVAKGPKQGKRCYVDDQGHIWIKDRAHANVPDHWDVQINDGDDYFRVDFAGNVIA
jgi:hypothetical protein